MDKEPNKFMRIAIRFAIIAVIVYFLIAAYGALSGLTKMM